jgi:starch synthase
MNIALVAGELDRIINYSGMASVVREIGHALSRHHNVRVIVPLFGAAKENICFREESPWDKLFRADHIDSGRFPYQHKSKDPKQCNNPLKVILFDSGEALADVQNHDNESRRIVWNKFFEKDDKFKRPEIGQAIARFNFLVADWLINCQDDEWDGKWVPDAIHCFNWEAALIPGHIRRMSGGRSVRQKLALGIDLLNVQPVIDGVNLLKQGIERADVLHFPNEWWRDKVCCPAAPHAHGLGQVLSENRTKVRFAAYGINKSTFDWQAHLEPVGINDFDLSGKRQARERLLHELCLDPLLPSEGPVFLVGNRLTHDDQKNYELIEQGMRRILVDPNVRLILRLFPESQSKDSIHTMWQNLELLCGSFNGRAVVVPIVERDHRDYKRRNWGFLMLGSDIVIMPSRFEPAGMNHLQAMFCGCPVIGTQVGDMATTIRDCENGWVLQQSPRDEVDDFVDTCQRAISTYRDSDRWCKIVTNAQDSVRDWCDLVKDYEDLYA